MYLRNGTISRTCGGALFAYEWEKLCLDRGARKRVRQKAEDHTDIPSERVKQEAEDHTDIPSEKVKHEVGDHTDITSERQAGIGSHSHNTLPGIVAVTELLIEVLLYLPPHSLFQAQRVCHGFCDAIMDSDSLLRNLHYRREDHCSSPKYELMSGTIPLLFSNHFYYSWNDGVKHDLDREGWAFKLTGTTKPEFGGPYALLLLEAQKNFACGTEDMVGYRVDGSHMDILLTDAPTWFDIVISNQGNGVKSAILAEDGKGASFSDLAHAIRR